MPEPLINSLNEQQLQAAKTIDRDVRIVAGAGSGKTRVLMARIEYLIDTIGIWPNRILAITFTNKAANEMKERLEKQMPDVARDVRISTIHSLCVRILREDSLAAGYPKNFQILDRDDQESVLRPIYKSLNLTKKDLSPSEALSYISNNKSADISWQNAKAVAYSMDGKIKASIYERYEKTLEDMKAMDFDDLLLQTNKLLKTDPQVRQKWQNRLDYLHVDEFQDVDPVQYSIIKLLKRDDAVLCVVGDPDQTIYTWRGAAVDIILNFEQDFPGAVTVVLNENYRSTKSILDASNALIAHNKNRIKKDLFSQNGQGSDIDFFDCGSPEEEALRAAKKMDELHRKGTPWSEMAVLYRSNYLSRNYEKLLRQLNIPYHLVGAIRFYERMEIKDMLCYLRLLSKPDPEDPKGKSLDLSVIRVINTPKRAIGAKTVEQLQEEALQRNLNLLDVCRDPQTLTKAAAAKVKKFADLIDEMRKAASEVELDQLIPMIVSRTGYDKMTEDNKEPERMENVQELAGDMAKYLEENPQAGLDEYLQEVALFSSAQTESQEGVTLMTVHAAKGLEFDAVFVTDLNEGVFPTRRAAEGGDIHAMEEERRLLYVAMTRARKELSLLWHTGPTWPDYLPARPSRFLREVPRPESQEEQTSSLDSPFLKEPSKAKKKKIHKGSLVTHSMYGEGVVLDLKAGVATIAFGKAVGTKRIKADHPTLSVQS